MPFSVSHSGRDLFFFHRDLLAVVASCVRPLFYVAVHAYDDLEHRTHEEGVLSAVKCFAAVVVGEYPHVQVFLSRTLDQFRSPRSISQVFGSRRAGCLCEN